jgi:hypothetical protein
MENKEIILKFSNSVMLPITIVVDNEYTRSIRPLKGEEISIPKGNVTKIENLLHSKVIRNLNDGIYYIDKEKIKWLKVLSIFLFPIPFLFVIESIIINLSLVLLSLFSIVVELNNFVIKNSNNEVVPKPYDGIPKLTSKSLPAVVGVFSRRCWCFFHQQPLRQLIVERYNEYPK